MLYYATFPIGGGQYYDMILSVHRRSATHAVIIWRPLFCDRRSACV